MPVAFRYHGNYCGPGWSAGKWQNSVDDPSVPAIDDLDRSCLEHDKAYHYNSNLRTADFQFFRSNILRGFGEGYEIALKRNIGAIGVGLQGLFQKNNNIMQPVKRRLTYGSYASPPYTPVYKRPKMDMVQVVARRRGSVGRIKYTPAVSSSGLKYEKVSRVARSSRRSYAKSTRFKKRKYVRSKRSKRSKKSKFKGPVYSTNEASGNVADKKCTYVGHSTHPVLYVLKNILMCLCNRGFAMHGNNMRDYFQATPLGGEQQWEFEFKYYGDSEVDIILSNNFVWNGLTSFNSVLDNMVLGFAAILATGTNNDFTWVTFRIVKREYNPVANTYDVKDAKEINLRGTKFEVYCRSALTIQNLSRGALGTEADEVDNIPLIGFSYDSNGSGLRFNENQRTGIQPFKPLICNHKWGVGSCVPQHEYMMEPPRKYMLEKCTNMSKVGISPGQVKMSTLSKSVVYTLDGILKSLRSSLSITKGYTGGGLTRWFALEKLLGLNTEAEADITLNYQVDNRYTTRMMVNHPYAPMALFENQPAVS